MRLDHIAFRVADREKTAEFLCSSLGYKKQTEFEIEFPNGTKANCIALEPPEKTGSVSLSHILPNVPAPYTDTEYHMAPEIFVSDGEPGSIVGEWVAARAGIGGVHHFAYEVDSVEKTMAEWKEKGWAEFASESPLDCEDLAQVFTKPSELTGIIFEFIERRGQHGFCENNVLQLMESTKGL